MIDRGKLKVGRASAGSGKTFTLTVEYITLLVENPNNYQHILAVTFTNKATNEMKSRIIDTLYKIANGDPKGDGYLKKIMERNSSKSTEGDFLKGKEDWNEEDLAKRIREQCRVALSLILHDYSRFRIETIDSFFQSIIRDLARELNLTANLRVDLNQEEVLEEAVKNMIDSMKKDDEVYNAVLSFVQDKMNEEKSRTWKIDSAVIAFSKYIFNENYLKEEAAIKAKTSEAGFFAAYKNSLKKTLTWLKDKNKENAKKFLEYSDGNGFSKSDFIKGTNGVYGFFEKIAEGKIPTLPTSYVADNNCDWLKNSTENAKHISTFQGYMLEEIKLRRQTATAIAILQNLNQMSLLGSVDKTVRKMNDDENRILLADNAHKLNQIIENSDVPFIYEKSASTFKYIMIDEFQDTSELQWKNFRPLIKESLGNGCMCLIVGDVKQSIYRWRNSDWSILNNIGSDSDFASQIEEESLRKALDTNHRSAGNIVTFNNEFFKLASEEVTKTYKETFSIEEDVDDITKAYRDVEQLIEKENEGKGYVEIREIKTSGQETENKEDSSLSDANPMLLEIENTIIDLKENHGVLDRDIAILARHKKDLKAISAYLKENMPDVNVISSEAYQLDSSEAINLIILALRVISGYVKGESWQEKKTYNDFLCATLAYKYQEVVKHSSTITGRIDRCFQASAEELEKLLPEGFISNIEELQVLPIYELCEQIYNLFGMKEIEGQSAYLFYFFDQLDAFVQDKSADIDAFLGFWDEDLFMQTIPMGKADGIQLLTIHKSKGLEFHTVIVPYCNWEMGGLKGVIWCKQQEESQLPVTPINFSNKLIETDFADEFKNEELKNYVDNLNLMYVAFTRASQNLIILTCPNNNKQIKYSTYDVIAKVKEQLTANEKEIVGHKDDKEGEKDISVKFQNGDMNVQFRQSNKSKDFIEEDEENRTDSRNYIKKGLVIHKVFEMIKDEDDIERVILELEQEGLFEDSTFKADITKSVKEALTDEKVRGWFKKGWNVMNECSIIMRKDDGSIHTKRPDRVIYNDKETIVTDYKTGRESKDYENQVKMYMELLRNMGMPDVKGYLWYIKEKRTQEV